MVYPHISLLPSRQIKLPILKKRYLPQLLLAMTFSLATMSCNGQKTESQTEISMDSEIDKVSYSLGVNIAKSIESQGMKDLNTAAFNQAINDVFGGGELKVSPAEAEMTLQSYFSNLAAEQETKNKAAGLEFLEANKSADGVVSLPSGLQYIVMKEGDGAKPGPNDKVTTHYHGTTIDGEVFDSSVDRGQPASFPVGGVIAGWTEALQLMPVGSKWKLFIPSDLAYGARGAGPKIGPHATLIFEVELLSID